MLKDLSSSIIFSFVVFCIALLLDQFMPTGLYSEPIRFLVYLIAYLPVGFPVIKKAVELGSTGSIFTEYFLMAIATIGAFAIGEYPEAVAVMLFYEVGEFIQHQAVANARSNIKALLDLRPHVAHVLQQDQFVDQNPQTVDIGAQLEVRKGERVPLDGSLLDAHAELNLAALTGESLPKLIKQGEEILAGAINAGEVFHMQVRKSYNDSAIAKILELVEHASTRKSETELLIRKLARIYTPVVVFAAVAIIFVPYFFVQPYVWHDWIYRAMVFLVLACPCALVISIPLGYFGGLGAASQRGILFKGSNYLDLLSKMKTLVMDKTGTITQGKFAVTQIEIKASEWTEEKLIPLIQSLESKSTHPLAKALTAYGEQGIPRYELSEVKETPGKGIQGQLQNHQLAIGNPKLMQELNIELPVENLKPNVLQLFIAVDGTYVGWIGLADQIKPDAAKTISDLRKQGVEQMVMLSGDSQSITQQVAQTVGIDIAHGDLLPVDKFRQLERLKMNSEAPVAFMGDGINDAPVIAASDIGIAMGAMGSDLAIETADIVIQTDEPHKLVEGMRIANETNKVIWQNIGLAFFVKFLVMALGAWGFVSMWAAVFADVGVALLAILNAKRIQNLKW